MLKTRLRLLASRPPLRTGETSTAQHQVGIQHTPILKKTTVDLPQCGGSSEEISQQLATQASHRLNRINQLV